MVGNRFDITLIAKDNGFPALETFFIVEIIVMDINDEIPSISVLSSISSIDENLRGNILNFHSDDPDTNSDLTFELKCSCQKLGNFTPCSNLAILEDWIKITGEFDFEKVQEVNCSLKISDLNGESDQSNQILFDFEINDVNDNIPSFDSDFYNFSVLENIQPGQIIGSVHAIDQDEKDEILYSIDENDHLTIDQAGNLRITYSFDFEGGYQK